MQVIVTILAVLILTAGILVSRKDQSSFSQNSPENDLITVAPTTSIDESTPEKIKESSVSPFPTLSPTKQPTVNSGELSLKVYAYPGTSVISSSDSSLTLQSNDNPDTITNWYEDKISSQGMSINTFVVTKADDKVLNKLVGARGDSEVRVEIEKESDASFVLIKIYVN